MEAAILRKTILDVVDEFSKRGSSFQEPQALSEIRQRLGMTRSSTEQQQMILDYWQDMFRSGVLGSGFDLSNPGPPFCHVTHKGREALRHLSRDPANPDGYLAYLDEHAALDPIARSYVIEALGTYNTTCFKATAVMVGAAAERLILSLRDTLIERMKAIGNAPAKNLNADQIKTVRDALTKELESHKKEIASADKKLAESFSANWMPFCELIRRTRNDAGHPVAIDPVTPEAVHAALLVFPEMAKLVSDLDRWIRASLC